MNLAVKRLLVHHFADDTNLLYSDNNYLLTGKKVALFFPRKNRDILLFIYNISRVFRGTSHFLPVTYRQFYFSYATLWTFPNLPK